ncbi:MAG TPA: STAS domain-containing protein [Candidatus Dormibacteraeota bacterium]|nr:STAS domain-containing protein [Candidatus Dormibacteraeota bacterium]
MSDQAAVRKFTFDVDSAPGGMIVRCHGRLVAGQSDQLQSRIRQLIPDNKRIVLDLTDLAMMDSMGLGILVRLYVVAKAAGCELQLLNIGKRIQELLGMSNLLSVFTVIGESNIRML